MTTLTHASIAALVALALPSTALAYDGGDLLEIGVIAADNMDEAVSENSAAPIFAVIRWIAEKTAPKVTKSTSSSDDTVTIGGWSDDPHVAALYAHFAKTAAKNGPIEIEVVPHVHTIDVLYGSHGTSAVDDWTIAMLASVDAEDGAYTVPFEIATTTACSR